MKVRTFFLTLILCMNLYLCDSIFAQDTTHNVNDELTIDSTIHRSENGDSTLSLKKETEKSVPRKTIVKVGEQKNTSKGLMDSVNNELQVIKKQLANVDSVKSCTYDIQNRLNKMEEKPDNTVRGVLCIVSMFFLLNCVILLLLYRTCRNKKTTVDIPNQILPNSETSLNDIKRELISMKTDLSGLKILIKKLESTATPSAVNQVAYDAAVDAWIHINNHLSSLGKNRKKIQHVYALLAGLDVSQDKLQEDLSSLDDERREEVSIIISDINRFKVQHFDAIEGWLSSRNMSLTDAIRFPLGETFNNELDEDLTGDNIEDGETISMVASLGYIFPDSHNGCYRVKSKVLV